MAKWQNINIPLFAENFLVALNNTVSQLPNNNIIQLFKSRWFRRALLIIFQCVDFGILFTNVW